MYSSTELSTGNLINLMRFVGECTYRCNRQLNVAFARLCSYLKQGWLGYPSNCGYTYSACNITGLSILVSSTVTPYL